MMNWNKTLFTCSNLSNLDLISSMIQAGVQSYFAINDAQDTIAEKQSQNIVANRFMSYGTFHTFVKPTMRYGVVFGGTFKGMQMDIDRLLRAGVATDNDRTKLASFNASQGARQSANEHLVPEQLFDNPNTKEKEVKGVSAVKALQIAQEQGQKIYTITKENYAQVLPKLRLSSTVMTDIRDAVNAGRVVTTHEKTIYYKGWKGGGYVIIDPHSGTGAYLIDGGANGGYAEIKDSKGKSFSLVSISPSLEWLENSTDTLSKFLALTKNAFELLINQTNTFLTCNKEIIINTSIAIGIGVAIFVSVSSIEVGTVGTGTPVAVLVASFLASLIPSTALAANNEECEAKIQCPKASKFHLKAIDVFGFEHQYKQEYGLSPVSHFDICACKDGAIVFASPAGTCNKSGATYIPSYERWQNPVVSWENN